MNQQTKSRDSSGLPEAKPAQGLGRLFLDENMSFPSQAVSKFKSVILRRVVVVDSGGADAMSSAAPSISEKMVSVRFRSSGFDYMRVTLAALIIILHTISVSYGPQAMLDVHPLLKLVYKSLLPIFFALSGFLVAGSLQRSPNLRTFLGLRVLRLVPALSVEVLLSAIVIGAIFTTLPLDEYFRSEAFSHYFLNIVGDVHFYLPGVFPDNPLPDMVNLQLWTIPYELRCYIFLSIAAVVLLTRYRNLFLLLLIPVQIVFALHGFFDAGETPTVTVGGSVLVLSFMAGVLLYLFRDVVKYSAPLAWLSVCALFVCLWFPSMKYLCPAPAAYLTVYLGLLNPPRLKSILSGDYSYGLYLYGFPIQQAVASFGPKMHHWYVNLAISFPLAAACAVGSWWLVEKNCLSLRRYLKA